MDVYRKELMKELRREIKEITEERRNLLQRQRKARILLDKLKEENRTYRS